MRIRSFARLTALSLACAAAALAATSAHAIPVIGLTTTNALVTFDSSSPMMGSTPINITGLAANERILSIDLRPTTGVLYGVSNNSRVFSISTDGAATLVSALTTPLASQVIGIDFNPAADLAGMASLRIVSSTGQNLAYNVATGATTLATGIQSGISAVAYANNDLDPTTATALYYLDSSADLLKVATANFNAPVITTVGALGLDANGVSGFDVFSASTAFAAMTDSDTGKSGLYSINLSTGAATLVGDFGIGGNTAIAQPLVGLTVAAAVPEPGTLLTMLAGLAGVGFVAARRRRGPAA